MDADTFRRPMTFVERLTAAWKAFQVKETADREAFRAWAQAHLDRGRAALLKLDGFDQALLHSAVAAGRQGEEHFARVIGSIEALPVIDQVWLAHHIGKGNPEAVMAPTMRKLMAKLAPHVANGMPDPAAG